jgi:hypothetical protein
MDPPPALKDRLIAGRGAKVLEDGITCIAHLDKSLVQGLSPFSAASQDAHGHIDYASPSPTLQAEILRRQCLVLISK